LVLLDPGVDLLAIRRRYQDQGWSAQTRWELPTEPWDCTASRVVCVGAAETTSDGARAVWAAVRGAGVAVAVDVHTSLGAALVADLSALGDVSIEDGAADTPDLGLDVEQSAVLRLLAEGCSIPQVAEQLFLSTRTTERRLAAARKALGVRSTAQAIVAFLAANPLNGSLGGSGGISGEQP
jgi:DNA-binding CsgD family transcriptional regulator